MTAPRLVMPARAFADIEAGTCRLLFPAGSVAPDGDYWVRGGLCWPRRTGRGVVGAGLVAALHIPTQTVYILDQHEWSVVDPWSQNGALEPWPDLAGWLNRCWAGMFCFTYYWHGDKLTKREYLLQIANSALIQPKPELVRVEWTDDSAALATLALWGSARRLVHSKDGLLKAAIERNQADAAEIEPALEAWMAVAAGLAKRPGVARGEKD